MSRSYKKNEFSLIIGAKSTRKTKNRHNREWRRKLKQGVFDNSTSTSEYRKLKGWDIDYYSKHYGNKEDWLGDSHSYYRCYRMK